MTKIFISTILTFICGVGNFAFAGTAVSGGGHGLKCGSSGIQALDYYEAKNIYGFDLDFGTATDEATALELFLKRIGNVDKPLASLITDKLSKFTENMQLVDRATLEPTPDAATIAIPLGCELVQIVNRKIQPLPLEKKYLIDAFSWTSMDYKNRAMMIAHEVLYELMQNKNMSARNTRYYNGLVWSKAFAQLNELENFFMTSAVGFNSSFLGTCTSSGSDNSYDGKTVTAFLSSPDGQKCSYEVNSVKLIAWNSTLSMNPNGNVRYAQSGHGFDGIAIAGGQISPTYITFDEKNFPLTMIAKNFSGKFKTASGSDRVCSSADHYSPVTFTFSKDGLLVDCR